ncbi:MAG: cache domain-containing protein [Melioribacteraceae bacterium]|nr:cache domain-containing protein [Melioribacteraceae bacterium]MCF8353806.1 cache domain-containing protein [Melioribacteraceae bacterium]MCF8393642.1 cache domain-containing protein [Melioribacteraceae bacterium]MCF8419452.1 cache domain-containing protein [Melioribacteraceae bacterium]
MNGQTEKIDSTITAELRAEVEASLKNYSLCFLETELNFETAFQLLETYLKENPKIKGAAFAFNPSDSSTGAAYVFREGDSFVKFDPFEGEDDYTKLDWYAEPVKSYLPFWTQPYFDSGGSKVKMITYSLPVYKSEDLLTLIGVLAADIEIK